MAGKSTKEQQSSEIVKYTNSHAISLANLDFKK
jgi:hypothetical protein